MAKIVNKALSSVVFSNYPQLTVQVADMAEEMCALSIDDDFVERIKGATQSILSPNLYATASVTLNVLSTSPQVEALIEQCRKSSVLDGNVIFTEHSGKKFSFSQVDLSFKEVPADGKQAHIEFTLRGDYLVNGGMI